MTKLTFKDTYCFFKSKEDLPKGSLNGKEAFRDLKYNRLENGHIVYSVTQSGFIEKIKLLETFHTAKFVYDEKINSMSFQFFAAMQWDSLYKKWRWHPFFVDQNAGMGEFQTFANEKDAINYSKYLKENEEYVAYVVAWRKKCLEDFSDY